MRIGQMPNIAIGGKCRFETYLGSFRGLVNNCCKQTKNICLSSNNDGISELKDKKIYIMDIFLKNCNQIL